MQRDGLLTCRAAGSARGADRVQRLGIEGAARPFLFVPALHDEADGER
jgi:hypothetical protein